jgi:redox-sensitive bicupin YhaK (pirin superfamily)
MKEIRRGSERGFADHGWLKSFHSFSFADYFDPRHVGFGALRVINEDRVAGGAGFGAHSHRDMEIVTYVLEGELAHEDSTGTHAVIRRGDVQRMSAGRGVTHSEFNHSKTQTVHFLQIWIKPDALGIAPEYEQKNFPDSDQRGRLCLIASPDGAQASVRIHQDARVHAGQFDARERANYPIGAGRQVYLHVVRGTVAANGEKLSAGDALQLTGEAGLELHEGSNAEVLVFDLAALID